MFTNQQLKKMIAHSSSILKYFHFGNINIPPIFPDRNLYFEKKRAFSADSRLKIPRDGDIVSFETISKQTNFL